MARITKAEAIASVDWLRKENALQGLALSALGRGDAPDFSAEVHIDQTKVLIRGFGLGRIDGGVVLTTYSYFGDRGTSYVSRPDEWAQEVRKNAQLLGGELHFALREVASALERRQMTIWSESA